MPRRSSSHQLEDRSLRRFEDLLPDSWAVRPLEKDYGHDREVEIFEPDGTYTGLTFRAQLKATQKAADALSYSIKTEHLAYFDTFDVPTAIVRYVAETDMFYLLWHFNVGNREKWETQKTLTVGWSETDRLTSDNAEGIIQTLDIVRRVRHAHAPRHISIVATCSEDAPSDQRYAFRKAVDHLLELEPDFHSGHDDIDSVPFDISFDGETVLISVDCISSISFFWDGNPEELISSALYSIGTLLFRFGAKAAASSIALTCLEGDYTAPADMLAVHLSTALLSTPSKAVDLALLNGLDAPSTGQMMFHMHLLQSPESRNHLAAATKYFDACYKKANGDSGKGATLYSKANFLISHGEPRAAFFALNAARHLRPQYCETAYFLQLLGSALHLSERFDQAADIYNRSAKLSPGLQIDYCRADSLLLAGRFAESETIFEKLLDGESISVPGEQDLPTDTRLRYELCRWLRSAYGDRVKRSVGVLASIRDDNPDDSDWEAHHQLDPLDPLANFNIGVSLSKSNPTVAAMAFTAAGLENGNDPESWTNAVLCFFNAQDDMGIMLAISELLQHCGTSGYDFMRSELTGQGFPDELIEQLDAAVSSQMEIARRRKPVATEVKIVGDDEIFADGIVHVELFHHARKRL